MRIGILSDPHANLPAMEAVLRGAESEKLDALWCLGDMVGRGPHPAQVCALVRAHCDIVLAGNHDRVVARVDPDHWLGGYEQIARWSRAQLDDDILAWLAGLPSARREPGADLYHASPRDPAWEHIGDRQIAGACLAAIESDLCMVGHTHHPMIWRAHRPGVIKQTERPHRLRLDERRVIVNPGAVGAPDDGWAAASWMIWDTESSIIRWKRSPYLTDQILTDMEAALFPTFISRIFLRATETAGI